MSDQSDAREPEPEIRAYESFDDMSIPDIIARGIFAYGFERPSSIQQRAIVPMKEGRDLLAQAQSGTGKTGTFVIGSLCRINFAVKQPQALVICPTRELAQQTEQVASSIGSFAKLNVLLATGGNPLRIDIQKLRDGAQFIVGTPGRIFDLLHRQELSLKHLQYVIIDEADQMLENHFADQINDIFRFNFPKTTALALFSATMPQNVVDIANSYLRDPLRILLPVENVTLEGIAQYYTAVDHEEWKYDVLTDLYRNLRINQALIYVNKRQKAEFLANKMKNDGFTLECIHGDMSVGERKQRMNDFRSGNVRVLISTDLLARGIDVQQVSVVINYELPMSRENYIHRIGRTGRYGRKGLAINLIYGTEELAVMREIEAHYKITIPELPHDPSALTRG